MFIDKFLLPLPCVFDILNAMKQKIQLTVCLLFLFLTVTAQVKTIKGVVTDEQGLPLFGVAVLVKGTTMGTQTDIDGKYEISTKVGSTLEFSYLGYQNKSVLISKQKNVSVKLKESNDFCFYPSYTVVKTPIALGIKHQKENLPYQLSEVKEADLSRVKQTNVIGNLGGRIAGLQVQLPATGVGEVRAVLRGEQSVLGNNNVLYVIDGMPTYNPSDLNPSDVKSASVLSGAGAALYGASAANGVVLINTQNGKEGYANSVQLSSSLTFNRPLLLPEFQDNYSNAQGQYTSWGNKMNSPSTHKVSDFFRTGYTAQNTISYKTGGNSNNHTYLSASSLRTQGVVPNSVYNRYNLFYHSSGKFLTDDLLLDVSAAYTKGYERNLQADGLAFNPIAGLYLYPRGEEFKQEQAFERYDPHLGYAKQYWYAGAGTTDTPIDMGAGIQNPYWIAYRNLRHNSKNRLMTSAKLSYKINNNFDIAARVKNEDSHWKAEDKRFASTLPAYAGTNGYYGSSNGSFKHQYADAIAHYKGGFWLFKNSFHFDLYGGFSHEQHKRVWESYSGNLLQPNLFNYSNINPSESTATSHRNDNVYRNFAAFAQGELQWDYYSLTATIRSDSPSQLVYQSTDPILSYSVGVYAPLSLDSSTALSGLLVTTNYSQIAAPMRYKDWGEQVYLPQALQAERTRLYEVGFRSRWLNSHLLFDATFYRNLTNNQLVINPLNRTPYTQQWTQTGEVENKGVEMQLSYNNNNEYISQKIGLVAAYNQHTLHNYPNTPDFNNAPSWLLGLNGSVTWQRLTLDALITARFGGKVKSNTELYLDLYGVSKASGAARNAGQTFSVLNNDYLYSATNVRLQELALTYKLKTTNFKGLTALNIALVGNNLFMLYNKAPFDPELIPSADARSGYDLFMLPSLRSYGLNLTMQF